MTGESVPCATCGTPTSMLATKRCNGCWEVESRLPAYLASVGGKRHLLEMLVIASGARIEGQPAEYTLGRLALDSVRLLAEQLPNTPVESEGCDCTEAAGALAVEQRSGVGPVVVLARRGRS